MNKLPVISCLAVQQHDFVIVVATSQSEVLLNGAPIHDYHLNNCAFPSFFCTTSLHLLHVFIIIKDQILCSKIM